jgi:hypothetical protein
LSSLTAGAAAAAAEAGRRRCWHQSVFTWRYIAKMRNKKLEITKKKDFGGFLSPERRGKMKEVKSPDSYM